MRDPKSSWAFWLTVLVAFLGLYLSPDILWLRILLILPLVIYCIVRWLSDTPEEIKRREEEALRKKQAEADQRRAARPNPKSLNIEKAFLAQSPASFDIQYRLRLLVETTEGAFDDAGLSEEKTQTTFAERYDRNVFQPLLRDNSYRFHFDWNNASSDALSEERFLAKADHFLEREGELFYRRVPSAELDQKLQEAALTEADCRISGRVSQNLFSEELIERNYSMLTGEQKEQVEADERYQGFDEALVVAALKRRLDFLRSHFKQAYESDYVTITTEYAGRTLKVKWEFKPGAPRGCELLGFRKTGGFYPDRYVVSEQGELRIQGFSNGEALEKVNEGESYFYTFLLGTYEKGHLVYFPAPRCQITIATEEENRKLEATIRRLEEKEAELKARLRAEIMAEPKIIEEKPIDPAQEKISEVKTRLEGVFRFHEAMDNMEKAGIAGVRGMGLSKREQEEKIEFIRDIIRRQREEYDS
jgi:hypothetical protein